MTNQSRIKELEAQIPFALEEYNADELIDIQKELKSLSPDNTSADKAVAIAKEMRKTDGFLMKIDISEIKDAINQNDFTKAEKLLTKFRKTYPVHPYGAFFRVYLDTNGKFKYEGDYLPGDDKYKEHRHILKEAAKTLYLPNKEYEKAYDMYICAEDYEKARSVRLSQGYIAVDAENYEEAHRFFVMARDYGNAREMARNTANAKRHKEEFDKKVGDKQTYLELKVQEKCEEKLATLKRLKSVSNAAPITYGIFCILCFLVAFALSIAMHWDPSLTTYVIYIFFAASASIGIHKLFDIDFQWLISGGITVACLVAPKLLHMASMRLFSIPTPAFVLLNIVCAVPFVFTLVREIQGTEGKRADDQINHIVSQLDKETDNIKNELVAELTPKVGKTIATKWVDELKNPWF